MKILLLSRYTRLGASSRLRTMQYLPALAREGIEVQVVPFFDDAYLHTLYAGSPKKTSSVAHVFNRIRQVRVRPAPDMIWLEYETLPWVPWLIERAVLPRRVPIVSDYDDAIFHRYDKHERRGVRAMLGKKIAHIMSASDLVMAGNPYLSDYALGAGASRVETVPTVVDLDSYAIRENSVDENRRCVGWIGTPQTWQSLAHPIQKVLDPLLANQGALFRAVGASMEVDTTGTLEILPWAEDTEASLIQSMDIGVMPLPDTPWTRGKCGYKLIQYMACGLPVVASPVGVNKDIVEHGVNGFLASSEGEWRLAIDTLLSDAELRRRMGAAGRKKIEEHYSLQVWGPRVARLLRSVVDGGVRN